MVATDLGTKRQCPKCAAKFYDFGAKETVACPKCGKEWKVEDQKKKKVRAAKPVKKETAIPANVTIKKLPPVALKEEVPEVEDGGETPELEPIEDEEVEMTSLEEVEEHEEEAADDPNSDDAEDDMFATIEGGEKLVDDLEDYIESDDDEDEEQEEEE